MSINNHRVQLLLSILFVALMIIIITPGAFATTITVNSGDSIQAAINSASPGDTIQVNSGTYVENLDIDRSITLTGIGLPTVDGSNQDSIYVIEIDADNVTVQGFNVINDVYGIYVGSNNCNVTGNKISSTQYGLNLYNAYNTNVTGNNVDQNSYEGIYLQDSNNNTISGNTANNDASVGIDIQGSCNNTITGNTANDSTGGDGITIGTSSDNNTFIGNILCNNNRYGIELSKSNDSNVTGNLACNNGYDGMYSYSANGTNFVTGNTMNNNSGNGISLYLSDGANFVTGNTVTNNLNNGIELSSIYNGNVYDNIVVNNCIDSTSAFGIGISGALSENDQCRLINNTVTGNVGSIGIFLNQMSNGLILSNHINNNVGNGLYIENSKDITVTDNQLDANDQGIYVASLLDASGHTYSYNINILSNVITGSNNDCGLYLQNTNDSLVKDNIIQSNALQGIYITSTSGSNNNHVINNTVTGNAGTGIYLTKLSNGLISSNRVNDTTQDSGMIMSNSHDITIFDNQVNNNDAGVAIGGTLDAFGNTNSYNINVSSNAITGSIDGSGLVISNTNESLVKDNVVRSNGHNGIDISSDHGSYDNQVINNTVTDNAVSGINLLKLNAGLINSNHVNNNVACGIYVWDSHDSLVTANQLDKNDEGIHLYGKQVDTDSYNMNVMANTVTGCINGPGITISETNNSLVKDNVVQSNNADGIRVMANVECTKVQLNNNTVTDNNGNGIDLYKVSGSLVSGNHVNNNGINDGSGIVVGNCRNDDVIGNQLDQNNLGIRVVGSADSSGNTDSYNINVSSNTITGSTGGSGITLITTINCVIQDNVLQSNAGNGIVSSSNTDPLHPYMGNNQLQMVNNTVIDNGQNGFELHTLYNCTVLSNHINNNAFGGIFFEGSHDSLVTDNQLYNNTNGITSYDDWSAKGKNDSYNMNVSSNVITSGAINQSGIGINGNNSVVKDNVIQASGNGFGINIGSASAGGNEQVINNTVTGTAHTSGIICWYLSDGLISSNSVTGTQIAIDLLCCHDDTVIYNVVDKNGGGIAMSGNSTAGVAESHDLNISYNTVTNGIKGATVDGNGIMLYQTNYSLIKGNTIKFNAGMGISFASYNVSSAFDNITENIIANNTNLGINAGASDGSCVFWLNSISCNNYNGSAYVEVYDNQTKPSHWNTTVKIDYTYKGKLQNNYTGNYWGEYQGLDQNQDGIGDTKYYIGCWDVKDNYIYDYYPMIQKALALSDVNSDAQGTMFRSFLNHSGVYNDGGIHPGNSTVWMISSIGACWSSPVINNGIIYVGNDNGDVYAFNASTATQVWKHALGSSVETTPAVTDGMVFLGCSDKKVYALNAATGDEVWNYTTGGVVSQTSPAVDYGIVFIGSNDKKVYALNAATGVQVWNYTTGGNVMSSPAVANSIVYVGSNDNKVYALDALTGTQVWNHTVGGSVESSPAVVNGLVYVGSDDNSIYALNATTGVKKWSRSTGNVVRSSPAVANGIVYIGSDDGTVYAYDAVTGADKWSYPTSDVIRSSPAVANGIVYIGSEDDNVYALDAVTGDYIWDYGTSDKVYSSPIVNNSTVYVVSTDGNIYAIGNNANSLTSIFSADVYGSNVQFTDLSTGNPTSVLWDFGDGSAGSTIDNPFHYYNSAGTYHVMLEIFKGTKSTSNFKDVTVADAPDTTISSDTGGMMYRSYLNHTGVYDDGGTHPANATRWTASTGGIVLSTPAIANGLVYVGSYDGRVYAFDNYTGAEVWNYTIGGPVRSSPAIAGDNVYIGSTAGKVFALDVLTGDEVWDHAVGSGVESSPAVAAGVVYVGSDSGNVYALNAVTGDEIWNATAGNSVISSPAVVDNVVYVGDNNEYVYAFNATTGIQIWSRSVIGSVWSSPAIDNGVLYVGTYAHLLYAIDASTGAILRTSPIGGGPSSPAVDNGIVYIGDNDGKIFAYDAGTGAEVWNYATGYATGSPAIANGIVYIGSGDHGVYAFDAASGVMLWNYTAGDMLESDPVVFNGTVYIGCKDNKLYAIGSVPGSTPTLTASFTANQSSGPAPLDVQFTDTSAGGPTSYAWNFGDGSPIATIADPVYEFGVPGDYTVTLTIGNSTTLQTSTTQTTIHVNEPLVPLKASFTADPTTGPAPLNVQFTDTSTGGPTSYAWDFGNGDTSADRGPALCVRKPGRLHG